MEGTTPIPIVVNDGLSTGAKIAIGATLLGLGVIGYFVFVHEQEKLTADAKFNRVYKFIRVEPKTEE